MVAAQQILWNGIVFEGNEKKKLQKNGEKKIEGIHF